MNTEIIDELVELYEMTKNECHAKELFFDSLKENLRKKIKEKEKLYKVASDVLKQYKVSCTVFLENKYLDFNISGTSVIIAFTSLIFSTTDKHFIKFLNLSHILYLACFISILLLVWLLITRHQKECKVHELLYALKDIEKEKNEENAV